jgi:hypothetical protein
VVVAPTGTRKKYFCGALLKLSSYMIILLRKSISTIKKALTMHHKKLSYRAPVGATITPLQQCPKSDFPLAC